MTWEGLSPPYGTIVADPPWEFGYRGGGSWTPERPEGMGYSTMPVDDICALPVADLAATEAYLCLWVTRDLYREGEGVRVARAWGFEPFGEIVWEKHRLGTGGWPRPCHEPLLLARRGGVRAPVDRSLRSVQKWPNARIHSAKPDALCDLVEQMLPGPYVELFARAPRLGWDHWGQGYEIGAA